MARSETPVFNGTLAAQGDTPVKQGSYGYYIPDFDFSQSLKQSVITNTTPDFPFQPGNSTDGVSNPLVRGRFGFLPENSGTIDGGSPVSIPRDFNLLLNKLDADTGVSDSDYTSTIGYDVSSSYDIYAPQFNALLTKLDGDTGVSDTDYSSTLALDVTAQPQQLIANINLLLQKLDVDGAVADTDYFSELGFQV